MTWSNGAPFDGYVLLAHSLPSGYSYAAPVGTWPNAQLPPWLKIPITAGAFNTTVQVHYNADLEPPNTRYVAYWYDAQDTLLSGPSAVFDVTTSPYAITVPALTVPSASGATPAPPTTPS